MFEIQATIDHADRILSDIGRRQLPFAIAQALNDTARDIKDAEEADLPREFDRPTPFTRRGLFVQRATKNRPVARVGFKDIQAGYLRRQVTGGVARPKKRALVVPVNIRRNMYGNMTRGAVAKLAASPKHFVARSNRPRTAHLPPGIYRRLGGGVSVKMEVAFEPRATYRPRYRYHDKAGRKARDVFPRHFVRRLGMAIQTAR